MNNSLGDRESPIKTAIGDFRRRGGGFGTSTALAILPVILWRSAWRLDGKNMKSANNIDVLYDGNCPFWVCTTHFVKRFDRRHRIHLTNIAARKFDARIFDKSQCELTGEIHALRSDGTWLKGLDAFRELCSAVGLGPVFLLTRLPVFRQLSNMGYRLFARTLVKTSRPPDQTTGARTAVTTTLSSTPVIRIS